MTMKKRQKYPKKQQGDARVTKLISACVTNEEHELLVATSQQLGITLSSLIRQIVVERLAK